MKKHPMKRNIGKEKTNSLEEKIQQKIKESLRCSELTEEQLKELEKQKIEERKRTYGKET